MRPILPTVILLAATPFLAAGEGGEHRPWSDVDHWAAVFDDPARDEWQKPLTLLELLGIERGERVADLGAGTGYFTKLLSIEVGETGRIYAVDVEPAMLDHLMGRDDIITERVVPVQASKNDPNLPEGEIDLVVSINTWHHIDKRSKYLKNLRKCLSPEGRVVIVDFREGDLPVGPPDAQKLPHADMVAEFEKAGWRRVAESVAFPYQYAVTFLPPERPDTRRVLSR